MMSVIDINDISKKYRLGYVGVKTLADDINRLFAGLRGREDPTLKIGRTNKPTPNSQLPTPNFIWALKDINLKVEQGEVLGIIGKNGAGKSTLLKILSKVTVPTSGTIKIKGRIASLLEVGTGFHPELTGRENIFLNGAILGMTKTEIHSRFDEIVDFSGVEKYIDTPVKRYSSGMYVRLAFAVAAHLEPEILIVDEVLAVGDAEFQKKCIGKMKDVSSKGRTVLFVSHNMASIMELCTKGMLLQNGRNVFYGDIMQTVSAYLGSVKSNVQHTDLVSHPGHNGNLNIQFVKYDLLDENSNVVDNIFTGRPFRINLDLRVNKPAYYKNVHFSFNVVDEFDRPIFHLENTCTCKDDFSIAEKQHEFTACIQVDDLPVPHGKYYFHLFCSDLYEVFDEIKFAGELIIEDGNFFGTGRTLDSRYGMVLIRNKWEFICS
ncbi:MAG: ABC transporter ATP-binding protein [Bacteroidales bacterium]|jgi:lipopolysaccharide transport system ATP-binding protein